MLPLRLLSPIVFTLPLTLAACAGEPAETADVDGSAGGEDGKADHSDDLYVRVAGTSMWFDWLLDRRVVDGRTEWVLAGRSSRNLDGGHGFVFDDPVGEFGLTGDRAFEVVYPAGDRGLAIGVQHFVGFDFHSGTPEALTARLIWRPRLTGFSGSGATLDGESTPVWDGSRFIWRLRGRTWEPVDGVKAQAGGQPLGPVVLDDDDHFHLDLDEAQLVRLAGSGTRIDFRFTLPYGTYTKSARLEVAIKRLGLTSGDPYEVWPPPTCDDAVRACLQDLDAGADTEVCGDAREVMLCGLPQQAIFDDVAFAAAMDQVDALLADPAGFAGDAAALAGADRVAQYSEAVRMTIEYRFEQMFGTAYASVAARDAAVAAVVTAVIDLAYARPFELLDGPHPPAPGSLAGTRQVIADYLLTRLAEMNLEATEFGRSYDELTRLFRDRHVDDLRFFREQAVPIDAGNGVDVYVGNWLDPLVEIRVNRSTGVPASLLFEID